MGNEEVHPIPDASHIGERVQVTERNGTTRTGKLIDYIPTTKPPYCYVEFDTGRKAHYPVDMVILVGT